MTLKVHRRSKVTNTTVQ